MIPIDELLHRLDGVVKRGNGWYAKCPAHEDRKPSLSVGTGEDGRILLHCFVGCPKLDVIGALGLELRDLMPDRPMSPDKKAWRDNLALLGAIEREAVYVMCRARDMAEGRGITKASQRRLQQATERISEALRMARGGLYEYPGWMREPGPKLEARRRRESERLHGLDPATSGLLR